MQLGGGGGVELHRNTGQYGSCTAASSADFITWIGNGVLLRDEGVIMEG